MDACKSKRCALASEECQRGASLGNQSIVFKLEIAETLTELDDESVVTFVRSEDVRSATDDKIWKILFGCELFCGDEVFEGVWFIEITGCTTDSEGSKLFQINIFEYIV